MTAYTIERRTQHDDEAYYVIIDEARREIIDEFETIEAAREAVRWLP
jgi:hypothetical protein